MFIFIKERTTSLISLYESITLLLLTRRILLNYKFLKLENPEPNQFFVLEIQTFCHNPSRSMFETI